MLLFIVRRLLTFFPVFFVTIFISFIITQSNEKEIIESNLEGNSEKFSHHSELYQATYKDLGFNKPLFYFTIEPAIIPDSLYLIADPTKRQHYRDLYLLFHDKYKITRLLNLLEHWKEYAIEQGIKDSTDNIKWFYLCKSADTLSKSLSLKPTLDQITKKYPILKVDAYYWKVKHLIDTISNKDNRTSLTSYLPVVYLHKDSRFNHWLKNFFVGNWGVSYYDKKKVLNKIIDAALPTLLLSVFNIFFLFIIGIFIGLWLSYKSQTFIGGSIKSILLFLHGIPNYTLALWFIILFCCGGMLCWLPANGLGDEEINILSRLKYFVLPVSCWVIPLLSIISFHFASAHEKVLNENYVLAARSRGLSFRQILFQHSLKPTLLTVLPLLGIMLPAALSGSVLIENIFGIPGLGKLGFDALTARDVPVVLSITVVTISITLIVQLLVDVALFVFDPRLNNSKD